MNEARPPSRTSAPLVITAIGGDSLIRDREHGSVLDQHRAAGEASHHGTHTVP